MNQKADLVPVTTGEIVVVGPGSVDIVPLTVSETSVDETAPERYIRAVRKHYGSGITVIGADGVPEGTTVQLNEVDFVAFKVKATKAMLALATKYAVPLVTVEVAQPLAKATIESVVKKAPRRTSRARLTAK